MSTDIYESDLAKRQVARDAADYRRSLYTNTKPDHPLVFPWDEPCRCERGDDRWERSGTAMRVEFPKHERAPRRSRGRSR